MNELAREFAETRDEKIMEEIYELARELETLEKETLKKK